VSVFVSNPAVARRLQCLSSMTNTTIRTGRVGLALLGTLAAWASCARGEATIPGDNPMASFDTVSPAAQPRRGRVVEVAQAGSYSYLRIASRDGRRRWVVTLAGDFRRGDEVTIRAFGTKRHFRSRRLGRRFDALTFAVVRPAENEA
jgi:hypothetical protein